MLSQECGAELHEAICHTVNHLGLCNPPAFAEVKLVREYLLKPPRDRRVIFAMAVTPENDVFSLVANDDGTWRFSRVRHWLDQQPREDSLTLPGLVQGGREGWKGWGIWSQQLSIAPDGKLALGIISANHAVDVQPAYQLTACADSCCGTDSACCAAGADFASIGRVWRDGAAPRGSPSYEVTQVGRATVPPHLRHREACATCAGSAPCLPSI